jgi:hypothetical protein
MKAQMGSRGITLLFLSPWHYMEVTKHHNNNNNNYNNHRTPTACLSIGEVTGSNDLALTLNEANFSKMNPWV